MNDKNTSLVLLISYLKKVIIHRFKVENEQETTGIPLLNMDSIPRDTLSNFIISEKLSKQEIIILLLAIVPHVLPSFFSDVLIEVFPGGGSFPEFGGVKGKNSRGIIPTGETVLFVLFGKHIEKRSIGINLFHNNSILFAKKVIYLEGVPKGEPISSGKLFIDEENLFLFVNGLVLKPQLSQNFPASLIETNMNWEDLILKEKTISEIKEIETWLKYNDVLMNDWNMKNKIKPGYRVMFHGPPGTGKTLTASLLGKYVKKDVYRIDLSMVVSKYIGETEKNLSSLFDKAINKDWILFFDEADSIFGKRTNVKDAHDKYANQEVSYLLQRIEAHPGLIILASNFKNNIDTAFARRFHSMIEFEIPSFLERSRLWRNILPENIDIEETITIDELSKMYTITGSNIVNVIQYAAIKTIANDKKTIQRTYLLEGIKREYLKEGKTMN